MLKRISLLGLGMAIVLATGYADQSKIVLPVNPTDRTDGKQMYTSYCAPCHGTEGRGNGAIAGALKAQPTDLTALARQNKGKFPETHVAAILRFGTVHNADVMPDWAHVLGNMSSVHQESERDLRTSNLVRYLRTIQVK